MPDYLGVLRENPQEAQALFADLLISVTTFFRDTDRLRDARDPGDSARCSTARPLRIRSGSGFAGCATGEEAYSIAILLLEEAARHDIRLRTPGVRFRPR